MDTSAREREEDAAGRPDGAAGEVGVRRRYPPGPRFWPRLFRGEIFRQHPAGFMVECAARYGSLVHYTTFGRHVYQLNDPALVEDFFLKDAPRHHRGIVMQGARAVLGNGLLTSEEPLHMRQRRLAQPAFHRNRIAAYGEVIGRQALEMTEGWRGRLGGAAGVDDSTRSGYVAGPGTAILDMRKQMLGVALRIVGECLFSLNVSSESEVEKISSAVDAFAGFLPLAFLPFPELIQRLPIAAMRRIREGRERLDGMIYGMIRERRAAPGDRGDLLSMLMATTDPEAGGGASARMSDVQLRDECLTILLAGHETTANGLSFALWLMARHPEAQARVAEEAADALGDRTAAAGDYGSLRYAAQVFAEAMRLYPPVWVTARTAVEEYEIAGYRVPKGAILLAPQFVVHRDPRYFPDPEVFDPQRFSEEKKAARPRYAYFPFAGGGRQCIGEGLAWMEGVFVLATICRDWELSLPAGAPEEIAYKPAISLRPAKPVWLEVKPRAR